MAPKVKLQISGRFKKRMGCRTVWVFRTNRGEMNMKQVAKYVGCGVNSISQWLRRVDGDVTHPYFVAKMHGEKTSESPTAGEANWGDLGKDPRTENLVGLKEPGTWEKDK